MKKEDLDALASLYEGVYSPAENGEYLSEEYLEEQGGRGSSSASQMNQSVSGAQLLYGPSGKPKAPSSRPTNVRGGGTRSAVKPAVKPAAKPTLTDAEFDKKYGTNDPKNSLARPETAKPRPSLPGAGAPPTAKVAPSKPATPAKPAGSAMDQWAAANPKLAAAKAERDRTRGTSATTNPLMKDFKDRLPAPKAPSPTTAATGFAKATPSLGSSSSAVQSGGSAASSRPTTNQTATAFSSPSLVKSTPATTPAPKPAATLPAKRPGGPGTGAMTRGGASGDIGPNARTIRSSYEWGSKATLKDVASLYSSIYEGKKKDQDQDGDTDFADVQIARMIASGMSRAEAIAAVKNKEYNEEFVTEDPVQDFRDMRRAKENAAGLRGSELSNSARPAGSAAQKPQPRSREFEKVLPSGSKPKPSGGGSAAMRTTGPSSPGYDTRRLGGSDLRRLSNSYEFEGSIIDKYIGEAAKRTPKKVRGSKNPVEYMKGRSDAGKRISGDEDTGPRYYTLGRSRGAEPDSPTAPGARPKNTPKLAGWEKDDIQYRKANLKAGRTHKVGGEKGLPEEYTVYEIVASYLLENNFAETLNDANVIIENMSETWVAQILESFE